MLKEKVKSSIEDLFRNTVKKEAKIHNAYLLVHSEKLGIHEHLAEGTTGSMPASPNQPFYIASVSKLITATLIGILHEKSLLSFEDPISNYIDQDLLENLHVYEGKDYSNEIKIKHLLNHTSGLNDFAEDTPDHTKSMIDMIIDEPSRQWTPREIIEWSKKHLKSFFPPGKGFHYSDTGYHLLGLIIEKITNKAYHELLHEYIFEPLQMNHSYFCRSEPIVKSEYPLADLYIRNINITHYNSLLSMMYTGGGIISTSEDLLIFMKALVNYEIISKKTVELMKENKAKFFLGIDYGLGLMMFKTIPILMPEKYNVWGNAGSTGSFMFYHPATESYIIGTLNHFQYNRKGIRLMLKTIDKLIKCEDQ